MKDNLNSLFKVIVCEDSSFYQQDNQCIKCNFGCECDGFSQKCDQTIVINGMKDYSVDFNSDSLVILCNNSNTAIVFHTFFDYVYGEVYLGENVLYTSFSSQNTPAFIAFGPNIGKIKLFKNYLDDSFELNFSSIIFNQFENTESCSFNKIVSIGCNQNIKFSNMSQQN